MKKVFFRKKPLYKKQNALLAYLTKPRFVISQIHTKAPQHVSFWHKYKELLAPVGAVAGMFLLYLGTRGAMLQGSVFGSSSGSVIDGSGLVEPEQPDGVADSDSVIELIIAFTNWLMPYIVVLAVVMIIYAAILMVTAAGNDDQISKGKTIIVWTIIALFIVLASYAIVNTVINFS